MMREKMTPQRVWQEFTRAQNFNNAIELYETVEQNEDFYIGNQWRGVNAPNLDHPVMNMLCRVVKFFISSVMSDDIGISVTDFDESSAMKPVLDMLGVQFDQIMEGCGFKRKAREVIRNSAVDGDGCMHFYFDPEDDMQGAAGTAESFGFTPTPGDHREHERAFRKPAKRRRAAPAVYPAEFPAAGGGGAEDRAGERRRRGCNTA